METWLQNQCSQPLATLLPPLLCSEAPDLSYSVNGRRWIRSSWSFLPSLTRHDFYSMCGNPEYLRCISKWGTRRREAGREEKRGEGNRTMSKWGGGFWTPGTKRSEDEKEETFLDIPFIWKLLAGGSSIALVMKKTLKQEEEGRDMCLLQASL